MRMQMVVKAEWVLKFYKQKFPVAFQLYGYINICYVFSYFIMLYPVAIRKGTRAESSGHLSKSPKNSLGTLEMTPRTQGYSRELQETPRNS